MVQQNWWSRTVCDNGGKKSQTDHTLPSHWPVFWFLLKPALHWHIALTFVWLQTASSPHGFVFFPHTSPLETTNKRQDFDYTSVLWILDTCCVFLLMCRRQEGIIPFHIAHNTTQTWAYIYYHKQQNIASKMRRLQSFLITSSWHSVLFISSERLFDLFGRVNCRCTHGPCSLARPSHRRRSRWRGRTAAGSGCSAGCRMWTLSSHKVEVFRPPPLLQDMRLQWKKAKRTDPTAQTGIDSRSNMRVGVPKDTVRLCLEYFHWCVAAIWR